MQKIANPNELQAELRSIMAFIHASEKPDRSVVASKLCDLADRVAYQTYKPKDCPECKGTGKVKVQGRIYACDKCRGTGTVFGDSTGGGKSVKKRAGLCDLEVP